MDLTSYVSNLGREFASLAGASGGEGGASGAGGASGGAGGASGAAAGSSGSAGGAGGGGAEVRALVERLTGPLESAIRMTLLEVLSAAADEITRDLAPGSVELRLRGRDPSFVVSLPVAERPESELEAAQAVQVAAPEGDLPIAEDGPSARINVRLPEQLKAAIEEAAAKEGRSVNAWLGRAAASALQRADREPGPEPRGAAKRASQRLTGWVR